MKNKKYENWINVQQFRNCKLIRRFAINPDYPYVNPIRNVSRGNDDIFLVSSPRHFLLIFVYYQEHQLTRHYLRYAIGFRSLIPTTYFTPLVDNNEMSFLKDDLIDEWDGINFESDTYARYRNNVWEFYQE